MGPGRRSSPRLDRSAALSERLPTATQCSACGGFGPLAPSANRRRRPSVAVLNLAEEFRAPLEALEGDGGIERHWTTPSTAPRRSHPFGPPPPRLAVDSPPPPVFSEKRRPSLGAPRTLPAWRGIGEIGCVFASPRQQQNRGNQPIASFEIHRPMAAPAETAGLAALLSRAATPRRRGICPGGRPSRQFPAVNRRWRRRSG